MSDVNSTTLPPLTAVLADDEPLPRLHLRMLLEQQGVVIVGDTEDAGTCLPLVERERPDLLFLDIQMPIMTGMHLADALMEFARPPLIVFVTGYSEYAIEAFDRAAFDYLLKPINRDELKAAVEKVIRRMQAPLPEQLKIILDKIQNPAAASNRIALPTMEGLQMISVESIISCEANDNYTTLILKNDKKLVVSSTLKIIEEMLEDHVFIRVHRSFLVNLDVPVKVAVVGQGQGVHALFFRPSHQFGNPAGPIEQALMAMAMQMHEGLRHYPGSVDVVVISV